MKRPPAKPPAQEEEQEAAGTDLMGFGRYSYKTYEEVLTTERDYAEWLKQTAYRSTYWPLRRFVVWAETMASTFNVNQSSSSVAPVDSAIPNRWKQLLTNRLVKSVSCKAWDQKCTTGYV